MLRVEDLTYAHPGQTEPYRFTFIAEPGAVTAISGTSGSGKSTLLDLVAGFLTPVGGSIDLDGQTLLPLPPEARPVSLLLQSESLFEHLSASRNIALGLPRNIPRAEAGSAIESALHEVGLPGIGSQVAETLSGGQKQRVALARTLLWDRKVLLLDEPFSALDDESRAQTRDLVARLTIRQNWITLLVSHNADDVASLASRRYRIVDGQLQAAA